MQSKPRQVHFIRRGRHIQPCKDVFNIFQHIRLYLSRIAALIEALQTAMPKAPYHVLRQPVALHMSMKSRSPT
jgi:hypothetical protein